MNLGPEGPARRDVGPFTDSTQAMVQFAAQMHGMPAALVAEQGPVMVALEACLLAGLEATEHEKAVLASVLSSEAAVIVAGMIIRARMGRDPVHRTVEQ